MSIRKNLTGFLCCRKRIPDTLPPSPIRKQLLKAASALEDIITASDVDGPPFIGRDPRALPNTIADVFIESLQPPKKKGFANAMIGLVLKSVFLIKDQKLRAFLVVPHIQEADIARTCFRASSPSRTSHLPLASDGWGGTSRRLR